MRIASTCILLSALGLSFSGQSVSAQISPRQPLPRSLREITGTVRDARTNAPIVGAVVELESEMGESIQQTFIGASGRFEFRELQAGRYYVVAHAASYRPSPRVIADLALMPQQTVVLSLEPVDETRLGQPGSSPHGQVDVRSLTIPPKARQQFLVAQESLVKKADATAALAHLQKATRLYPEYVEAYHLMGTLYMDQKDWDQAEKMLNKALELNNRYAPSYFALGALYNQQGKPAEAQKFLRRGLELDPESWQGHLELSRTYFTLGDLPKAEQEAVRAHELKPDRAVIHLVLADIYVAENSYAPAKTEYQHFLDRAPQSPWAPRVQEQIRQLDRALAPPQPALLPAPPQ